MSNIILLPFRLYPGHFKEQQIDIWQSFVIFDFTCLYFEIYKSIAIFVENYKNLLTNNMKEFTTPKINVRNTILRIKLIEITKFILF